MNKLKNKLSVWIPVLCLLLITSFAFEALAHEEECPDDNKGCDRVGDDGNCVKLGDDDCCMGDSAGNQCGLPVGPM